MTAAKMTLADLLFLRTNFIRVDDEDLEGVRHRENKNLDFGSCRDCCAITLAQHEPSCPHASVKIGGSRF